MDLPPEGNGRPKAKPRGVPRTADQVRVVQAKSVAAKRQRKAEVDAERQRGRRSLPDRTALSASDARSLVAPFLVGVNPVLNARIQGLLRGARSLDKSWDAVDEHMFGPVQGSRSNIKRLRSEHGHAAERCLLKASLAAHANRAHRRSFFEMPRETHGRWKLIDAVDHLSCDSSPMRNRVRFQMLGDRHGASQEKSNQALVVSNILEDTYSGLQPAKS